MPMPATTLEKFWASMDRDNADGCWAWMPKYPQFVYQGKTWRIQRLAFTVINGEVPEENRVRSTCKNSRCCNPEHLYLAGAGRNPNGPEDFWAKVDQPKDGCWEWQGSLRNDGYGQFMMDGVQWGTHRLAYSLVVGQIPAGLLVCHHCDNPKCCRPDHLYAGTVSDNAGDRERRNRRPVRRGVDVPTSVLTEEDVRAIRSLALVGWPDREIADRFGVHLVTINKVVNRKTWKHVV